MLAMLIPLLGPIFDKLIGLIPDPAAAARAKAEAMQMLIDAAQKADAAQMEVNKIEAGSTSMFIAGWRPFVGWVCAAGCAWNWIGLPVLSCAARFSDQATSSAVKGDPSCQVTPSRTVIITFGSLALRAQKAYDVPRRW